MHLSSLPFFFCKKTKVDELLKQFLGEEKKEQEVKRSSRRACAS
jgi:hypothetical protein